VDLSKKAHIYAKQDDNRLDNIQSELDEIVESLLISE
jgi:hypothetical protein